MATFNPEDSPVMVVCRLPRVMYDPERRYTNNSCDQVTGQELYMALLEATDRNVGGMVAATVADMLSRGVSDQIEACRQSAIK